MAGLATLGVVTFSTSSANATTYKVGPNKQYTSIKAVASQLSPGDVVEVDGNATYAGDINLTKNGTASNKITIRGMKIAGKRPVLSGGANTLHVSGDHYVVEGFEVTGGSSRCVFHHGDDLTLRDSTIHNCPNHGILGSDSDSGSLTMEYVEVYESGTGSTKHPVYIATDESAHPGSVFRMQHCYVHDNNGGNGVKTRAERNEIYYNWIEGSAYHELELIGPDGASESLAREDSDVVGNVFRKTNTFYVVRAGGDGTGQTWGRFRFVNNTFLMKPGGSNAFRLYDGLESIEMHNNVFYTEGGGAAKLVRDSDAEWKTGSPVIGGSHNWVPQGSSAVPSAWTTTILGSNPGFTDLNSFDLRPAAGSSLVDAGSSSLSSPAGHPFPSPLATPAFVPPQRKVIPPGLAQARPKVGAIDIGAYERPGAGGGNGGTTSSSTSSGSGGTNPSGSTSSSSGSGGTTDPSGSSSSSSSSGSAGTGGTGGTGGAGGGAGEPTDDQPGCCCVDFETAKGPGGMLATMALGMTFVSRRRRRRRA